MIVYRVLDGKNRGYKNHIDEEECLDSLINNTACLPFLENYSTVRPHPHDDGIRNFSSKHYFGFNTLKQLNSWFRLEERNAGAELGGKIQVLYVEFKSTMFGKTQCCFDSTKVLKVLGEYPMNHFDSDDDKHKGYPKWDD